MRSAAWPTAMCLALAAILALVPATASAQAAGPGGSTTIVNGTVLLRAGHSLVIPVKVSNLSYVVYVTASNVPVYTLVFDRTQLAAFNSTHNVNGSISSSRGNYTVNAFLANATRFVAVYSPGHDSSVAYYVTASSNFTQTNATTYVGQYYTLPPHGSVGFPIHIETEGSPSNLTLSALSSLPVSFSIRNASSGAAVFSGPYATITNLNTSGAAPTLDYRIRLAPGSYTLNITSAGDANATLYYEYHILPAYVDPFLCADCSSQTAPAGIASFGLLNRSGRITPYNVSTGSVLGYANISSMATDVSSSNASSSVVSLQLNDPLVVTDRDGAVSVYWPQCVVYIQPGTGSLALEDNILNISSDYAQLSDEALVSSSGGYVKPYLNGGSPQSYYGLYEHGPGYNYSSPLLLLLRMNVSVMPGNGVLVKFGVKSPSIIGGNSAPAWFDNVELLDPNASSASFYVSGSQYTPAGAAAPLHMGIFYDSELIFGGPGGGSVANFTGASARLGLFYYDSVSGSYLPYPSAYAFGADTAERAQGLRAEPSGTYAMLGHGNTTYDELYASPSAAAFRSAGDASPNKTEPVPVPTHVPVTTPRAQTPPAAGQGYILYGLAALPAALVVLAIAVTYLLFHARHGRPARRRRRR